MSDVFIAGVEDQFVDRADGRAPQGCQLPVELGSPPLHLGGIVERPWISSTILMGHRRWMPGVVEHFQENPDDQSFQTAGRYARLHATLDSG